MKKITFALAACVVFAFAACGNSNTETAPVDSTAADTTAVEATPADTTSHDSTTAPAADDKKVEEVKK